MASAMASSRAAPGCLVSCSIIDGLIVTQCTAVSSVQSCMNFDAKSRLVCAAAATVATIAAM